MNANILPENKFFKILINVYYRSTIIIWNFITIYNFLIVCIRSKEKLCTWTSKKLFNCKHALSFGITWQIQKSKRLTTFKMDTCNSYTIIYLPIWKCRSECYQFLKLILNQCKWYIITSLPNFFPLQIWCHCKHVFNK